MVQLVSPGFLSAFHLKLRGKTKSWRIVLDNWVDG